jgi:hypothetical protein
MQGRYDVHHDVHTAECCSVASVALHPQLPHARVYAVQCMTGARRLKVATQMGPWWPGVPCFQEGIALHGLQQTASTQAMPPAAATPTGSTLPAVAMRGLSAQ